MSEAGKKIFLQTVDEIVKLAGGDTKVARRFGYADGRAVWNWRNKGFFPPSTFDAWQDIMTELNISAPKRLWRQRETVQ